VRVWPQTGGVPCPQCGFDPPTVSPSDAAVALRSLPRRYRELVDPDDPDPNIDVEARAATSAIAALGHDLEQVLVLDRPTLGPPSPLGPDDDLASVTTRVADLVGRQPADAWSRVGVRDGEPVTALDLLREAVHAGVHHLRIARRDFDVH